MQFGIQDLLKLTTVVAIYLVGALWLFSADDQTLFSEFHAPFIPSSNYLGTGLIGTPLAAVAMAIMAIYITWVYRPAPVSFFLFSLWFLSGIWISEYSVTRQLSLMMAACLMIILETCVFKLNSKHYLVGLLGLGIVSSYYWTYLCLGLLMAA